MCLTGDVEGCALRNQKAIWQQILNDYKIAKIQHKAQRSIFSSLRYTFFLNIFLFVFYILQQTNKQKHEQGS